MTTRKNVYDIITERIIDKLRQGIIPWRKPWRTIGGLPKNFISKKAYRGVNIFLLAMQGYGSPWWLTQKQTAGKGGRIRKGEHGTPIVFWKMLDAKDKDGAPILDSRGRPKKSFLLRYYKVWNVEQVDGIDYPKPEVRPVATIEECQSVVTSMPNCPTIEQHGSQASYSPVTDKVMMPPIGTFDASETYYSTLYHELVHSTGHHSRIGREFGKFGDEKYAREELTAEMGAAMLCGHCGIETKTIDNSAAYVASWLSRISNDPKLVVQSGARAQKAADYILGVKYENKDADSDKSPSQAATVAA